MLSICIIAKNEEQNMERCLKCLQPYPFEIIVVDTGSTDKTKEIAQKYATHVYDFEWCDDFAAAKNYAISKAENEYVMVLDSDEFLELLDAAKLEQLAKQHPEQVGRIKRRNIKLLLQELERLEAEQNKTEIDQNTISDGMKSGETMLTDSKIPYILYQLGKGYYMAGDYEFSCEYFSRGLSFDLNPQLEYVIDMVETYGYALVNSGRAGEALFFENIYEEFGRNADFQFLMGLIYMNNARFEDAIAEFLKATKHVECRTIGVNSYLAYYNIGVIYECLGKLEEATTYYKKCGDYAPAVRQLSGI